MKFYFCKKMLTSINDIFVYCDSTHIINIAPSANGNEQRICSNTDCMLNCQWNDKERMWLNWMFAQDTKPELARVLSYLSYNLLIFIL